MCKMFVVLCSSIVRYACTLIVLLELHLLSCVICIRVYCYHFFCIIIRQTLGLVEQVVYIGRNCNFEAEMNTKSLEN